MEHNNQNTKIKDKKLRFERRGNNLFIKFFSFVLMLRLYRGNQHFNFSVTWKIASTTDKDGKLEVWREYRETESPLEAKTFH